MRLHFILLLMALIVCLISLAAGQENASSESALPGNTIMLYLGIITIGLLLLILLILVVHLQLLLAFLFSKKREIAKKTAAAATDENAEQELEQLQRQKKEVEDLIEIAKSKFHNRNLDEESFREIVRDQQKKLIEIESKISNLEKRVKHLEDDTHDVAH